jgi:hypothetical protein
VAAADVVDEYIDALPGEARRLTAGEWGVRVAAEHAAGWPLDIGVRLADGILLVQAHALTSPEEIDPWMLLWWNRQTRYVRFACTQAREVWVHGDMPVGAVDDVAVDRLMGLVVEGAIAVREFASRQSADGSRE